MILIVIVISMTKSILYLGDTEITDAASYLAGVMNHYRISFDYQPSNQKFESSFLSNNYNAIIISDYPADNFSDAQLSSLTEKIAAGLGLLMIGGWESFTGANHEYTDTPIKNHLPVTMQPTDDRVNCSAPCLAEKKLEHPIVNSLPFDQNPPTIGGFNRLTAKPDSTTILSARRFDVHRQQDQFKFTPCEKPDPLLVVSSYEKARVCVFATDVAPHWVGGLVDWGDSRVKAQAPGANPIEVGSWYAKLLANMVNWTAGKL